MPINHKVFLAQFDAIKKLAERESCVIVGRCADYALEDNPYAVSVFIKASLDERVQRIKRIYELMILRQQILSRRRIREEQAITITTQARNGEKLRATISV